VSNFRYGLSTGYSQERKEQQNILMVRKIRGNVNEVMHPVAVAKKE
jgi:hypothetical protein